MGRFFRGTDKQIAKIPEEVEVKEHKERKEVRRSIRQQIYDLICQGKIDKKEFEPGSLHEMKHGRAPRCNKSQEIGDALQDKKYHIHHQKPRRLGGRNTKENLVITTPRFHDEGFLTDDVHYGKYHAEQRRKKTGR